MSQKKNDGAVWLLRRIKWLVPGILTCWRALGRDVGRLAWGWWRVDRIRVTPADGQWLRLRVGERLVVRNHLVRVTGRCLKRVWPDIEIEYACVCDGGCGTLRVAQSSRSPRPAVSWVVDGTARELSDDEIVICG